MTPYRTKLKRVAAMTVFFSGFSIPAAILGSLTAEVDTLDMVLFVVSLALIYAVFGTIVATVTHWKRGDLTG